MIEEWGTAVFKQFDANSDGKLSKRELAGALKTLPKTKPKKALPGAKYQSVEEMIAAMDDDADGSVDEAEWLVNLKECPGLAGALAENVQAAGTAVTAEEIAAVTSEEAPVPGQWTYDFSDPDGPQLGTVAIEGSQVVHDCDDAVAIIAEHPSLGVPLPETLTEPVDVIVLVDRARNYFSERKFLVIDNPASGVEIGAFQTKAEIPEGSTILGQVVLVQMPWLPAMKPTKSGFMEEDEYF